MKEKFEIGAQIKVKGRIQRIRYTSPGGDFAIMSILTSQRNDLTIVGNIAAFQLDDEIKVLGVWEQSKYGAQLRVLEAEAVLPSSPEGIERFLSSQLKGVGRRLAKRIVDHFAETTFDVLDHSPERLSEVSGFTARKIEGIKEQWQELHETRNVFVFLQGQGLTYKLSAKLYAQYGAQIVPTLMHQPYVLAKEVEGIGFERADQIALRIGFNHDAPQRIEAGIDYALYLAEQNEGHCYLPYDFLMRQCIEILGQSQALIAQGIKNLVERGLLKSELDEGGGIIIYRSYMWNLECAVASDIVRLLEHELDEEFETKLQQIKEIEKKLGIDLATKQRQAVQEALKHNFIVITGGPGTGKTTLVKVLVSAAISSNRDCYLAAPTGRAAKRMSEATAMEAKTIHRLLEYSYVDGKGGEFKRRQDNPLEVGTYIIDEASMLDLSLIHSLLIALPSQAKLVLVGDVDQLPSVGAGSVLRDLIESQAVPVARLDEVFRQAAESLIVRNSHLINAGHFPELPNTESENARLSEFYLISTNSPERAEHIIKQLVTDRLPARFGISPLTDCQVLSPMKKNLGGVEHLNTILQDLLNPKGKPIEFGGRYFRIGDRVMQLKNDYDRDVYNGDIGIITGYDAVEKSIRVQFEDKGVDIPAALQDQLSLAYACTVHKSQGSEYPAVICVFMRGQSFMLQRNLVYTALTRAKRIAIFITDPQTLRTAIANNKPATRFTRLGARIAFKGVS